MISLRFVLSSLFWLLPLSAYAASDADMPVSPNNQSRQAVYVPASAPDDVLEKVIIVSRHGVRAPTKITHKMRDWAADDWPQWPVPYGYLTDKGDHLLTQIGSFYQGYIRPLGFEPHSCPSADQVYAWADVDERTRRSASALLQGMFPQCQLPVQHLIDLNKEDPVFHPLKAGLCRFDDDKAKAAVLAAAGGSVSKLEQAYHSNLQQMARVLNLSASKACQGQPDCELVTLAPSKLQIKHGHKLGIKGALGESASMAEVFLLEQAQGMQAGWGRVTTSDQWQSLLALHNLEFELLYRPPYLAGFKATPLLQLIENSLTNIGAKDRVSAAAKTLEPSAKMARDSKLLLLVGHDTNLASIAGAMGWQWQLTQQPDNTPPGAALVFELWRSAQGQDSIRVSLVYQTLPQMRITKGATPEVLALGQYPKAQFISRLQQALQPACLLDY